MNPLLTTASIGCMGLLAWVAYCRALEAMRWAESARKTAGAMSLRIEALEQDIVTLQYALYRQEACIDALEGHMVESARLISRIVDRVCERDSPTTSFVLPDDLDFSLVPPYEVP